MKSFDQKKILGVAVITLSLLGMIYYHTNVLDNIKLFTLYNLTPLDLVFKEGIDLKEYDGSVILNCIHGGPCPEGIQLKDDTTGQIIDTGITPKTAQPYMPPEDPNAPPDPRTIPDGVQQEITKLDITSWIIFGIIILGLISALIYVAHLKKSKK